MSGATGERADFEAWAHDLPFPLNLSFGYRSEDLADTYFDYPTRLAWAAWNGRAAIALSVRGRALEEAARVCDRVRREQDEHARSLLAQGHDTASAHHDARKWSADDCAHAIRAQGRKEPT